jgi:hypothetical protein
MAKKLTLMMAVALLACAAQVGAQSNELLDALLEEQTTSFGQASYLVLTAAGRLSEGASPAEAALVVTAQGWKVPQKGADEPLTLGEYSFLLMQAFQMKGGLMYRIFPGPRYAGRELAYLRLIRGDTSPYRLLRGEEAIGILGRLLAWKEAQS